MGSKYKYKILFLTGFLFFLYIWFSLDLFASNNVFLSTFPYKADVYINNVYIGKSPVVMVNLNNGSYLIRIEKEGYQTYKGKFTLSNDKTYNFTFALIPATFSFLVNNNFSIEWKGENIKSPFIVEDMSPGVYKISIKKESIKIEPDNIFSSLKWITLASSIISGGLYTYFEIFGGGDLYTQGFYDGLKYTFLTTGIISAGVSIYSFFMDSKIAKYSYSIDKDPVLNEDQVLFYNGLNLLNKGDFDNSLKIFKSIMEKFKNSKFYPSVLYYIGYIYEKKNNFKLALQYYEKLIYEYPVYEWYDITLLTAARIYYENGIYQKSLYFLNNILFVDKLIVSEDIVARYKFLNYYFLIKNGKNTKENIDNLNYYYNSFQIKYSNSSYKYEIFFYYSNYLLDNNRKEKALTILKILISTENPYKKKALELYNKNNN